MERGRAAVVITTRKSFSITIYNIRNIARITFFILGRSRS
jgi:hypothetical protein